VTGGITAAVEMLNSKWRRVSCRFERLRVLEEKLRDAQVQIEELKRINEALEGHLLLMGNGKDIGKLDMVEVKPGGANCLVLGDSIVRNVGAANANMRIE
jgi:predicted RNase H-like nuclease (RuvC/YqgF family)